MIYLLIEFNTPKSSSPDINKRNLVVEDPRYSSPDKKKRKLVLEDASILRSHQLGMFCVEHILLDTFHL